MRPAETSQQAVIDFLGRRATHGGAPVKRIDTHAAAVFLAGPRALKIKRALRFPFLDYSTLAKRKAACDAEIEVNRPYAPSIYRGVVAITREADGALAIGGKGEPVEWAVEMARFDETQTLDHLADAGLIDAALADALGRAVARAHAAAPVAMNARLSPPSWARSSHRTTPSLRALPELFPPAAVARTRARRRALAFARLRPLLDVRERAGRVRALPWRSASRQYRLCIDGAPVLVRRHRIRSAIATGDVLYDLAFLLMDLIERRLNAAANIVLNRYLAEIRARTTSTRSPRCRCYLSLRAAIRAKVTAARRTPSAEQAMRSRKARATISRWPASCSRRRQPHLLAVGGLSGTGKSLLARRLAPAIRTGPRRGAGCAATSSAKCCSASTKPSGCRKRAYTPQVTAQASMRRSPTKRGASPAAGHSAIVDAVCAQADERALIAQAAAGVDVPRPVSHRRSRCPARPRRHARGRRLRCRCRGGARRQEQYDLGTHAMDARSMPPARLTKHCPRQRGARPCISQAMHPDGPLPAALPSGLPAQSVV